MDSNLYISALQRQPCLLKTNSTRVLVTWLVTLLLIICPSSYKARLNNLIGTADIEPQIISPQWSNARPNFPTKKCVGGAKFGLVSRLLFSPNKYWICPALNLDAVFNFGPLCILDLCAAFDGLWGQPYCWCGPVWKWVPHPCSNPMHCG